MLRRILAGEAGRNRSPRKLRNCDVTRYGRQDVLRILHLPSRQLAMWQRAGLVPESDEFSFEQLVQLRKLRDLTATRISVKNIQRSINAMQRVSGMANPLLESVAVRQGSRVAFRQWGALVDPMTRQMAFDFELTPCLGMTVVKPGQVQQRLAYEAQEMFLRAVRLEEQTETLADAKMLYVEILAMQPGHAAAAINLGTLHYNQRDYVNAEKLYRQATVADPEYALAFFDLGNVLDEMQRLPEAVAAYESALALVPGYADAHYNLALAYERLHEPRRALRHWSQYAKLDPTGPWASHARSQAKKILGKEKLAIVARHGRLMKAAS